jgi:hypothetical protein
MTTTYWVVDVEVEPAQAHEYAERVKRWLIQEDIVLPTPPEPTVVFPVDSDHGEARRVDRPFVHQPVDDSFSSTRPWERITIRQSRDGQERR